MNLPLYNSLKTPMSTVFVPYGGIKGFFVTYNGSSYYAWEAACPNHAAKTVHRSQAEEIPLSVVMILIPIRLFLYNVLVMALCITL